MTVVLMGRSRFMGGIASRRGDKSCHRETDGEEEHAIRGVSRNPRYPTDPGEFGILAFPAAAPVGNVRPCHIWLVKFLVWQQDDHPLARGRGGTGGRSSISSTSST